MRYHLEKYTNSLSRHECPMCHDKHSFTLYVDENGNALNKLCGRCNHESNCGYHYPPKQYFAEHPKENIVEHTISHKLYIHKNVKKQPCTIPYEYLKRSECRNNNLISFLDNVFPKDAHESSVIDKVIKQYHLGSTKDGAIIYWQIDLHGRVRTGKIIHYNLKTGHRIKNTGGINWVHSIMKKQGLLASEWKLDQCLFGEHLLAEEKGKIVALVEAEKTAIICAIIFPQYIWLATGGKSQLNYDKLRVLSGRTIIMFPDVDGYNEWVEKAHEMSFVKILVSDILEKNASEIDRTAKIDIADWIISELEKRHQNLKEL